jgi:MFS family permease
VCVRSNAGPVALRVARRRAVFGRLTGGRSRGRRSLRGGAQVSRAAWRRLAGCTAAAALLQVDGTLITVALPSLAHGLRVSAASMAIVLTAYFAAYAMTLLPGGALVDRLGSRRIALCGLGVFALGVLAGAVSVNLTMLVAARVVQGVGAGLVSPAALAGAVSGFPLSRCGSALGVWGVSAGVANLLGPTLGGALTVAFGWRADWWALLPLSALSIWAIIVVLPRDLARRSPSQPGVAPLRNAAVLVAAAVAALTFAVMIGTFYLAEQYLQRTADYSALAASNALVLVAVMVAAAAPLAGRLTDDAASGRPECSGSCPRESDWRSSAPMAFRCPARSRSCRCWRLDSGWACCSCRRPGPRSTRPRRLHTAALRRFCPSGAWAVRGSGPDWRDWRSRAA